MKKLKRSLNEVYLTAIRYGTPLTLDYFYSFGVCALLMLFIQLVTGIFLTMFYVSHVDLAFDSIERVMRDIENGWLLRYMHANGASFFFFVIYIHIARGFLYGSYRYPRQLLWLSGVVIFVLMIVTAFLGYVLPWGQMSYWAATVITNLVSVIPVMGQELIYYIWGGYSVSNPTLNRFYTLHFLLPFLLTLVVVIHLFLLHQVGSSNTVASGSSQDNATFYPYYIIKDMLSLIVLGMVFFYFIGFLPNVLGHPDNYIQANPNATPEHIVPEWYFLPFYAILRSIPDKLLGVIALAMSLVCLAILPWLQRDLVRYNYLKPFVTASSALFIAVAFLLGYLGQCALESPYLEVGAICTMAYFSFFVLLPVVGYLDESLRRGGKAVGAALQGMPRVQQGVASKDSESGKVFFLRLFINYPAFLKNEYV